MKNELVFVRCAVGALVLTTAGCGLTRSRARAILSEQPMFEEQKSTVPWRPSGHKEWDSRGGKGNPKLAAGVASVDAYNVALVMPVHLVVEEITGMADAPGGKTVEFRWTLGGVPEAVRRLVVADGSGTAYLRKYDDGWRLTEQPILQDPTQISPPDLPITAQQEQEIRNDEAEFNRKLNDAQMGGNKLLTEFDYQASGGIARGKLTDTHLSWDVGGTYESLWLGCIDTMKIQSRGTGYGDMNDGDIMMTRYSNVPGCNYIYDNVRHIYFRDSDEGRRVYQMLQAAVTGWRRKYVSVS